MDFIKKIGDLINWTLKHCRPITVCVPPILLLCSAMKRPGLSALSLAAAIIQRLPEAGINTGLNRDGSPNKKCLETLIFCQELVREIKDNMRIDAAVAPGSIVSVGVGSGPAGPVTVNSSNILPSSIQGMAI